MFGANRIARAVFAAGTLIALSAGAAPADQPDPRGPITPWYAAQATIDTRVEMTEPLLPVVGFMSSGYRSIHFNSYFTNTFSFPYHVSADGDNVFVSDSTGNFVSMFQIVNGGTSFVRNIGTAGSGAGQFNGPEQVAVVGNDIYVADFANNRVQRFNKSTGAYMSQFGTSGSGPGQFTNPSGLVYNPINGFLYVSEVGNDRVQIFSTAGIYQAQFGSLGPGNGQLNNPYSLAVDSLGNIYAADNMNGRVSKFDATGAWIRHIAAGVVSPTSVAVDKSDAVWVNSGSGDVYSYDSRGNYHAYYYGTTTTWYEGYFTAIRGIAVTQALTVSPYDGSPAVVIADGGSQTVQLFSISAQPTAHPSIDTIPGVGPYTGQIAFDSAENIYFTSFNSNLVYKYNKFGAPITQWGSVGSGNGQFNGPIGIAVDDSDNVYVADRNNNRIQKFNSNGGYITQWGTPGSGNGQFNHPNDVATDGAWLYVTEEGNHRVQKFSLTGSYVRQWGTLGAAEGQFNTPIGIAVDRNRNQVYVSEYTGNRIQQFTVFGDFIKIIADASSGSGAVVHPLGVATDQHGNLYAVDNGNARIVQYNDVGTYLTAFAASGAAGIAVNPRNAQIYYGTIGDTTVYHIGAPIGKSDTVGVYQPSTQTFLPRNSNTASVPYIVATVALAQTTDLPLTGDWNGDGIDTPGLYRPSTSTFYLWDRWTGLSIAAPDHVLSIGAVGDRPIAGDWDGDGKDSVGVFRSSDGTLYLKNALVAGPPDYAVTLGTAADIGIAGDWDQDGAFSGGVFRPSDRLFHVTNRNTVGVVADDGAYPLGNSTDLPVTGDWTHSGYSGIGVLRPSTGLFYLKYNLDSLPFDSDALFRHGFEQPTGDLPIAGSWGSVPE